MEKNEVHVRNLQVVQERKRQMMKVLGIVLVVVGFTSANPILIVAGIIVLVLA